MKNGHFQAATNFQLIFKGNKTKNLGLRRDSNPQPQEPKTCSLIEHFEFKPKISLCSFLHLSGNNQVEIIMVIMGNQKSCILQFPEEGKFCRVSSCKCDQTLYPINKVCNYRFLCMQESLEYILSFFTGELTEKKFKQNMHCD